MGRVRCAVVPAALLTASWPAAALGILLDQVHVRSGSEPAIELSVSGPVVPWVRRLIATPNDPYRIYIDLADTVLGPDVPKLLASDIPGVQRIRAGQFTPTTARIVLDTTVELSFEVSSTDRRVTVTFGVPEPAEPGANTSPIAALPPEPAPPQASDPPAATVPGPGSSPLAGLPVEHAPNAPRPATEPPAMARDSELPLVVVDAGHGGHDPGAEGVGGILEKTVALQIAHRLAAKLPARLPVDSLLTRSDDSFVPLSARLPHRGTPSTIFLSLHANAIADPVPRGLEIFFGDHGDRESQLHAKQLARLVTRELRARLLRVRGRPRPGPFRVLTANDAPSVLIELGYLTHPDDAARLQDPRYQELLTDALVDAVAAFLQSGHHAASVQRDQDLVPSGKTSRRASMSPRRRGS